MRKREELVQMSDYINAKLGLNINWLRLTTVDLAQIYLLVKNGVIVKVQPQQPQATNTQPNFINMPLGQVLENFLEGRGPIIQIAKRYMTGENTAQPNPHHDTKT
ncbi:MAG: hypothetical protein QXP58_07010 [Thermoprotei archaeon]